MVALVTRLHRDAETRLPSMGVFEDDAVLLGLVERSQFAGPAADMMIGPMTWDEVEPEAAWVVSDRGWDL